MTHKSFFTYGAAEMAHLQQADPILAPIIVRMGVIKREVIPDLFTALVHSIVSQQISTVAARTVWHRVQKSVSSVSPEQILAVNPAQLRSCGLSGRKVDYIITAAQRVSSGELYIAALPSLSDAEIIAALTTLPGVGEWTAQMLLIFSLQRPNVLSYGDLAIRTALQHLYAPEILDKKSFQGHWERYSPYASVASLYHWAVAGELKR
ncbi:MAG: DNA-3-methyladenine glycosylase 2 family protein [Fibrobacter sp.]|nr:DNA-3-methyladenine glycosylase 2 family protein [Fibrobacter sp.]